MSDCATFVAFAQVGDVKTRQVAERVVQRQQVGERLTWVVIVGQGVDDGSTRRGGQLLDDSLREHACHDRGAVGRERPCGVLDRLTPAELEFVGAEHDRKHAQAMRCGLE